MQRLAYSCAVISAVLAGSARGAEITSVFQQGVSPTTSFDMGGTFVRNDIDQNQNTYTRSGVSEILVGINFATTFRGLLEIDLSSLAGQSIQSINSVSLTMTIAEPQSIDTALLNYNLSLYGNNADFDETTVKWTTAASAGSTLSTAANVQPNAAAGTTVVFGDSAAFESAVLNALNGPSSTLRLMLTSSATADGHSINFARFASDDHSTLSYRPSLSVTYTAVEAPEPSAIGLLGLGALSLLNRRRVAR